ncbi:MAG: sterol desaturase family protein [Spirochaetota bacterium]
MGATNAVLSNLLFAGVMAWVLSKVATEPYGLLGLMGIHHWTTFALTLLLLDIWTYWWHRFNHTIPFLWRFHRAHHTDTERGATSAYRFHPGEIIMSSILRIPLIPALGLKPEGLLWYEVILSVSVVFHHSNISVGTRVDSMIRLVIVSPIMHKLHHSVKPREFSSNYSSTLSVWDRLFGSWTETDKLEEIQLGPAICRDPWWQGYRGIMLTPFKGSRSIG